MKTKKLWGTVTMAALILGIFVSFYSCKKDECKCNGDCHGTQCSAPCANNCKCTITKASIVGRWVAIYDEEYGDKYVMVFREDGTGYGCEEEIESGNYSFSQFSYTLRDGKINLYGNGSIFNGMKLDYDLSSDGNKLTIYGMDDNDLSVLHFTRSYTPDTPKQDPNEEQKGPLFHVMDKSEMNAKGIYYNDPLTPELHGKYFYSFQFGFGIDEKAYHDGITKIVAHLKIDSGYIKTTNSKTKDAASIDIQLDIKDAKQTDFWDLFAAVSSKSVVTISYTFDYYKNGVKYSMPTSDSITIIAN